MPVLIGVHTRMYEAYKVDAVIPTENIFRPVYHKNCARPIEVELRRLLQSAHRRGRPRGFPRSVHRPPRTLHPIRRPTGLSQLSHAQTFSEERALSLNVAAARPLVRFPEIR